MKLTVKATKEQLKAFLTQEQLQSIDRFAAEQKKGLYETTLIIHDSRNITRLQQQKIYALLGDMAIHITGYRDVLTVEYYKMLFKHMAHEYGMIEDNRHFSFSNCSTTEANSMIELILKIIFDYNISLEYETSKMLKSEWIFNYYLLKNRVCGVCGKSRADVHHINRIGMGNNRNKIDHVGREAIALCREHHNFIDQRSEKEFIKKHKLMPIKLTEELVRSLGL